MFPLAPASFSSLGSSSLPEPPLPAMFGFRFTQSFRRKPNGEATWRRDLMKMFGAVRTSSRRTWNMTTELGLNCTIEPWLVNHWPTYLVCIDEFGYGIYKNVMFVTGWPLRLCIYVFLRTLNCIRYDTNESEHKLIRVIVATKKGD